MTAGLLKSSEINCSRVVGNTKVSTGFQKFCITGSRPRDAHLSIQRRNCYAPGMIRRALIAVSLLLASVWGMCQLPAPTAISDFGYTSCSHSSCLFVPGDQHPKAYFQGNLSYTVTESGKFTLSRGQKLILSTRLKDLSASVFVVWSERND
jgi:hypothetical protein